MRHRLLAVLLVAGCSLIKFNVSTPETRRQESEALARQAEQQRTDAGAKQKVARAEKAEAEAEAENARDEAILADLEAARAGLAAGVTSEKATAFAGKVRDAEGTALARDGRLD